MTELDFKCMVHDLGLEHYAKDDTYTYRVPGEGLMCTLVADFKKKEIRWPHAMTVTTATTSNFSQPENFVVFECVYRLLKQGYHPKDIELEPKWKLGHGASGGRADIWVRTKKPGDDSYESLLIIECKTYGREFNSAWKDTLEDGDQLFGYFAQEPTTKFLCLYASEYQNDKLDYSYHLINVQDNEEYIKTLKSPATFEKGKLKGRKELFKAWRETYKLDYATIGLFEPGIEAYHPGKSEYTISDLKAVDAVEIGKMYHRFAETLRKYNVSGRENAFDKLVNLMLAKVVDELQNSKLQFNWKGAAYDDDFRLQDRLQKLYKEGMQKFLGEDVTYIDDSQIDKAFRRFKNDPDATRDAIRKFVRELKFFTNNDFAFIDVHNENLFNKNAEVLRSVVRMLQDVRLRTDAENQFLGDLFENFLDQGVKQSEGQFFTPIPFVRFMISSLPIAETIEKMPDPPIMVDYACGAGHFLNEYARQVANKVPNEKRSDYYRNIYGIEKEYRLSKVSKVASFMYGQDQINIIYSDALIKNEKVKDGTVTFLATNPPYSVKGFLETLTEEQRKAFKLSEAVDDLAKNDDIECFFIERAAQLLAPGGMAAIVLPASILGTKGGLYEKARSILLECFYIVAIVEMGPRTFGKTGTNTATLFLRRRTIDDSTHVSNRVTSWFKGDFTKDEIYDDKRIRFEYASRIGMSLEEYDEFLRGVYTKKLFDSEMFVSYRERIVDSKRAQDIQKKKLRANYSSLDREKELQEYILSEIRSVEAAKLNMFMLAEQNPSPVVVVKGPGDGEQLTKFLGYEWSGRRGAEGLHILGPSVEKTGEMRNSSSIDCIKTPLFNPHNLGDSSRVNNLIRENFKTGKPVVVKSLESIASIRKLSDMVDVTKAGFENIILTSVKKCVSIMSDFDIYPLGKMCDIKIGGTPSRADASNFGGKHPWVSVAELNGSIISITKEFLSDKGVSNSNVKLIPKGSTLLSFKLSIGKTALAGLDLYTNEAIAALIPKDESVLDKYLFYFFTSGVLDLTSLKGDNAFGKSLNSTMLKEVKIPKPSREVQEVLVTQCDAITAEFGTIRMTEDEYRQKLRGQITRLGIVK